MGNLAQNIPDTFLKMPMSGTHYPNFAKSKYEIGHLARNKFIEDP
jgi:hypothetical protein